MQRECLSHQCLYLKESNWHLSSDWHPVAPEGSFIEVAYFGYITTKLFFKWLQHFIDFVKPTVDKKGILFLDGYTTYAKNLEALELAKHNGVIFLQLAGHTTHRLQPLDVWVFRPLQKYYDHTLDHWMTYNAGQCQEPI